MARTEKRGRILSLGGDFAGVTLTRSKGALTIDISALMGVDVTVINGDNARLVALAPLPSAPEPTRKPSVIKAPVKQRAYNIGDVLPDGWVLGPISPDTGIHISIEPESRRLKNGRRDYWTWYQGEDHAVYRRKEGHRNARQPSDAEWVEIRTQIARTGLNGNARLKTDGFCTYWASTPERGVGGGARRQYLGDTNGDGRSWANKYDPSAGVCIVRDEPGITLK